MKVNELLGHILSKIEFRMDIFYWKIKDELFEAFFHLELNHNVLVRDTWDRFERLFCQIEEKEKEKYNYIVDNIVKPYVYNSPTDKTSIYIWQELFYQQFSKINSGNVEFFLEKPIIDGNHLEEYYQNIKNNFTNLNFGDWLKRYRKDFFVIQKLQEENKLMYYWNYWTLNTW